MSDIDKKQRVNLLNMVEIIHRHLTIGLCQRVHREIREKERQRELTLYYLVQFWTAVILRAPASLTAALLGARGKMRDTIYPRIQTSTEAFFEKCRDLKWQFFKALYEGFTESILPEAPRNYGSVLGDILKRFPEIFVIDGSKLDAIRRRLKLLWKEKSVVLPGSVVAFYDLGRGITRQLLFSADAAAHELPRAIEFLPHIPKGTLILGDRLFALTTFFRKLNENGLYGLFRRNRLVKLKKIRVLSRKQSSRTVLEDSLMEAGSGQGGPKVVVRYIRYRNKGIRRDLITTVHDPALLSAEEALQLYPFRWSVERLFFDLKEVLNLHRFYAANPNAIAMQLYAAAIVHTACRIAQATIAQTHAITPEEISPEKFFPILASASSSVVQIDSYHQALEKIHGHLTRPDISDFSFAATTLEAILVEKRNNKRKRKRFCPSRKRWKSLTHINGFKKLS